MTTRSVLPILSAAVLAGAALSFDTVPAQTRYQLTPLPGIDPQSGETIALGLSENSRIVVGTTRPAGFAGDALAAIWIDGAMGFLPTAPHAQGVNGAATGINSAGTIVGSMPYASDSGGINLYTHAVIWQGGALVDLGTLPGDPHSFGNAINSDDVVVGTSGWLFQFFLGHDRAFRWENGVTQELAGLPGDLDTQANDINDAGVIVGSSGDFGSYYSPQGSAVFWDGGGAVALPPPSGAPHASATLINNQGVIVGGAGIAAPFIFDYLFAPVVWEEGQAAWLPLLPGDNFGSVSALNDDGLMLGASGVADLTYGVIVTPPRPVLWVDGQVVELSSVLDAPPGWSFDVFQGGLGVNAAGDIVGTGTWNGRSTAFIATPIP